MGGNIPRNKININTSFEKKCHWVLKLKSNKKDFELYVSLTPSTISSIIKILRVEI